MDFNDTKTIIKLFVCVIVIIGGIILYNGIVMEHFASSPRKVRKMKRRKRDRIYSYDEITKKKTRSMVDFFNKFVKFKNKLFSMFG